MAIGLPVIVAGSPLSQGWGSSTRRLTLQDSKESFMRFSLTLAFLFLSVASPIPADTITSGDIFAQSGGGNPPRVYTLVGPTISLSLNSSAPGGPTPAPEILLSGGAG